MSKQGMESQELPAGSLAARLAQARVERQRENEQRARELLEGPFLIGFERMEKSVSSPAPTEATDQSRAPATRASRARAAGRPDIRFALGESPDEESEPSEPAPGVPEAGEPPITEPEMGEPAAGKPEMGEPTTGQPDIGAPRPEAPRPPSAAAPSRSILAARLSSRPALDEPAPWVTAASMPTDHGAGWTLGTRDSDEDPDGTLPPSSGETEAILAALPATALPLAPAAMPSAEGEPAQTEIEALRAQLQQVQEELHAVRRRGEKDRDDLSRFAGEVILRIIPAVDDLDRALAHVPVALGADPWVKGVLMIGQSLHNALEQQGVERITPHSGEPFDPRRHEAIAQVAHDIPEDTITEVYRPGYSLHGRMLRPAQVQVAVRKDL